MDPYRAPMSANVAMRRDSVWSVAAVAAVVAILSASIPFGLEYFESRAKAPPVVVHHDRVRTPKLLEKSSPLAALAFGKWRPPPPPVYESPAGDHFMMLAGGCIARPMDHDPRGERGMHCSKDAPHQFICWNDSSPGGLRLPRL